eukprot:TRINITY_DN13917_c0_g1_i1.p1 TRINITY_DN13917_c0_g1~~TRINITY_DN13917_c0_g1_i1.p1  ORF type:complete len:1697 (-),score=641.63 TRINITY_DN13917_c0_g1_i1:67-5157(-)
MESVSNKSLWTLISSGGLQTEPGILETELLAQERVLAGGLASYKPNSKDSLSKFKADKEVGDSWKDFVVKLSDVIGVEENKTWGILCSYLSTEFRGTSESLADLLKHEGQVKPLMVDIWQFYRAERLYLLQVLKEVLTYHNDAKNNNREVFEKVFDKIDDDGKLKQNLIDQFKTVIKEKPPKTDSLGSQLATSCRKSWTHFNLREQSELLQLLMIYFHQTGETDAGDWSSLCEVFTSHQFGTKQLQRLKSGDEGEGCQQLALAVGHLEAAVMVQLLDLPGVTADPENHNIFGEEKGAEIEKVISGLGDLRPHGPPMLAWMLGQFLAKGQEGLQTAQRFGEVAIGGGVLQVLLQTLQGDYTAHGLVGDILHSLVYGILSALVQAFDPASMGLGLDTHRLVVKLLAHRQIAHHFWKNPMGLSLYFEELKSQFPLEHGPLIEVCTSLASASPLSCTKMISSLSSLPSFTDTLDYIPQSILRSVPSGLELTQPYFPYTGTESVCIPPGSVGTVLPNGVTVRWSAPQNGWQLLLAEIGHLASQVTSGASSVLPACLERVTNSALLVAAVLSSDSSLAPQLHQISHALLLVMDKFSQVSSPPLRLMAATIDIFSSLAVETPGPVLAKLGRTSLLPRLAGDQLHPGVVGQLLAGQETVQGEYPSLLAFLKLLTVTAKENCSQACIAFVLGEVLPHFSRWRYDLASDREKVAKLALTAVMQHGQHSEGLHMMASDRGLARSLLVLSSTGDRAVQTLLENQTNWEVGRGADLVDIVQLSLTILNMLVTSPSGHLVMTGPVGHAIRSPPAGAAPHYLLTLAHYTYFHHKPELAIAAVKLLSSISVDTSDQNCPVSVLACLSSAATAVRDQLLARLESNTEDIRLKIAIVELLSSCVEQQPGMVQLLMDINTDIRVVDSTHKPAGGRNTPPTPELVGDGCLSPVLRLLSLSNGETSDQWETLHLAIVKLIDSLWTRGRILAAQHLKEQKNFWSDLAHPLTSPRETSDTRHLKVKAFILRIISHELYTWTGKICAGLQAVIDKICDEKSSALTGWCDVSDNTPDTTLLDSDPDTNVPLFLLSSWRAFLLVLSKDSPTSLSPAACRAVFLSTTTKLSSVMQQSPPPPKLTVILSETAAVLTKRWQTKCTDSMSDWCGDMSSLLSSLASGWDSVHPRARLAVLGLALATLRISHFKLEPCQEGEGGVLCKWMEPVLSLLATNFRELEGVFCSGEKDGTFLQCPELTMALLNGLVNRLPVQVWMGALHREASMQLLLSAAGACCRNRAAPSFVLSILSLLVEVASTQAGVACLLLQDLARDLWLPLSDLPMQGELAWTQVRQTGLQLAGTMVRVGRRQAVNTAVTAAALMSEKIGSDLMSPRQDLDNLPRAAAAARFVGSLASYTQAWQTEHSASLQVVFRSCCRLLHTCTALLMRPSLLASLVKGNKADQEEVRRVRRLSSTSCSEVDVESVGPEAAPAHSFLLEIVCGCLSLLTSLSPPLPSLLSGEAMLDPDRWEPLLTTTFSGPTLEQDGDIPSYGLLLSLANVCVRTVSRDTRSPSPGRSAASPIRGRPASAPPPDTPERRRLLLVMEMSLSLLLSQSLLSLADPSLNQREKQLLRRELGAELGSITDTWRRHNTRGGRSPGPVRGAKSPGPLMARSPAPLTSTPAPGRAPKSPGPPPSSPQPPRSTRDGDNFMKFISTLVHNVFK